MTKLRDIYGPGFTHAAYLRALRAGHETGWWDQHGVPAPWPEAFTDTDTNSSQQPGSDHRRTEPRQNGEQPAF